MVVGVHKGMVLLKSAASGEVEYRGEGTERSLPQEHCGQITNSEPQHVQVVP